MSTEPKIHFLSVLDSQHCLPCLPLFSLKADVVNSALYQVHQKPERKHVSMVSESTVGNADVLCSGFSLVGAQTIEIIIKTKIAL